MKIKSLFIICLLLLGLVGGAMYYLNLNGPLLSRLSYLLALANPYVRVVKVQEGLRKEQIAEIVGDKMGWDSKEKNDFINLRSDVDATSLEGHYFPNTYIFPKDDDPSRVGQIMFGEFDKQTSTIKKPKSRAIINEETVLKIASIIQREAGGKNDMPLISGIIWNRIFAGMKLQMDATLQYVKGSEEDGWWKEVDSADKKIPSEYNTYIHKGLPPSAISNPGLAAISAAYNPQKTSCLFYLHDKNRKIHCTKTYEEHKKNIEIYY